MKRKRAERGNDGENEIFIPMKKQRINKFILLSHYVANKKGCDFNQLPARIIYFFLFI